MRLALPTVVLLSLLAVACALHMARGDLVGTYRARSEGGYALLALRADGTYAQLIHINETGQERTASGTWKYDPRSQMVDLQNDFAIAQNMLGPKVNGEGLPAEKWFGAVELCCDPNTDCYYKKLSNKPDPNLFERAAGSRLPGAASR